MSKVRIGGTGPQLNAEPLDRRIEPEFALVGTGGIDGRRAPAAGRPFEVSPR